MKIGIRGVTVSDVRGFGAQGGSKERHGGKLLSSTRSSLILTTVKNVIQSCLSFAGSEFSEDKFVAKVKMEIVVKKEQVRIYSNKTNYLCKSITIYVILVMQVESVINTIIDGARTGEIGDGKIFGKTITITLHDNKVYSDCDGFFFGCMWQFCLCQMS